MICADWDSAEGAASYMNIGVNVSTSVKNSSGTVSNFVLEKPPYTKAATNGRQCSRSFGAKSRVAGTFAKENPNES